MARTEPPRTGRLARGTITGIAAARIGMAQLGHRVRTPSAQAQADHEAALGRILFGALGQLRGSALKVSQLLSMHPGLLPDGVRQELARAHHQAPPLNRALVGRVFRQAFGQEPEALFEHFEPTAFAAAITSDMQLMRAALRALAHTDMPLPANTVVDSVMTEIEATLLREVDYLQEAEQLQWFAEHAALPGVVLAQPILSHTRAQVLTQQFLPGQHLQAWLATEPTQAQRDLAGQHLWDWFMHCLFVLGRVHADPHPGNFLFAPDGTVGVLDFGCTRSLSEHFRTQVTKAWSALLRPPTDPQRDALVLQAYRALGLVNASLPVPAYTAELAPALADMHAWQMEPFTQPVFDFGVKTPPPIPAGRPQRMLGERLVQVPGEMPAFERMWMGLMHLLTGLGARVHTHCPALLPS